MPKRRVLLRALLADLFFFANLHSFLSVAVYIAFQDLRYSFLALLLAIPFALTVLVRLRTRNIFLFSALTVVAAGLVLVLPAERIARIIFLIAGFAMVVYAFFIRLRGSMGLEWGSVALWIVLNMILVFNAGFMEMQPATTLTGLWVAVMFICHLVYVQTLQTDLALDVLADTLQTRRRRIEDFNNKIMGAFLVPAGLLLFGVGFVPTQLMDKLLARGLGGALMGFFKWLSSLRLPKQEDTGPAASSPPGDDAGELLIREVPWLQTLYNVAIWLILTLVVLAFLALILYALYRLYRRFYDTRGLADGDERESLLPELQIMDLPGFFRRLRRGPVFGKSERQQIRKQYYRKIQRHIRKGIVVRRTDTPWEIADKLSAVDGEVSALTARYNQARYSREEDNA